MKNILIILLALLAVYMLYFGISNSMLPPALTGAGFLIIAFLLRK